MKKLICALLALIICVCFCACEPFGIGNRIGKPDSKLTVHFIDVGQGDCILMESGGEFVLIDSGEREYSDRVTDYIKEQGAARLTYVIATHPHSDHIGGMRDILKSIAADNFITKEADTDTHLWTNLLKTVEEKGINYIDAKVGDTYTFGEAEFRILGPLSDTYEEYNSASVVTKVTFADISFLLTGDSDNVSNKEMMEAGEDLTADVIKLGHHGSSDALTSSFLQAVDPMFAVISCGRNNDYGHPHKDTVKRLDLIGCEFFRTDIQGTIVAKTDGTKLSITTAFDDAEGTYTAGDKRHDISLLNPVGNKSSMLFHDPICEGVETMSQKNMVELSSREEAIEQGYVPCPVCNP